MNPDFQECGRSTTIQHAECNLGRVLLISRSLIQQKSSKTEMVEIVGEEVGGGMEKMGVADEIIRNAAVARILRGHVHVMSAQGGGRGYPKTILHMYMAPNHILRTAKSCAFLRAASSITLACCRPQQRVWLVAD